MLYLQGQVPLYCISDKESLCAANENEALVVDEIFSIESHHFNSGSVSAMQFYSRPWKIHVIIHESVKIYNFDLMPWNWYYINLKNQTSKAIAKKV